LLPLAACGGNPSPHTAEAQMRFGVRMAERGLWSEAWFRFDQARALGAGNDPQVLNNLAVASEALGRFDDALEYYRRALGLAPGNSDLKNNYDRFVGFYEAFRAQADAAAAAPAPVATPAEPPADFGTPAPAPSGPADAPAGGVAVDPLPQPVPEAPAQPPPLPSEVDDPPPSDPDPSPDAARLSGGSRHG
jgi:hypothetical protein